MYSKAFCKVYNEFGWNYFPRAFGEQLLEWIDRNGVAVKTSMDLACGTGILCEVLADSGIEASGMDFSEGMIAIARESRPELHYDVADMIAYRPDRQFDLVTCTGDALNHIMDLENVGRIFENVHAYLRGGGYFIFDLLNENEVPKEEPFDLDFSETVRAQFHVTRNEGGRIHLKTTVWEDGELAFEEVITETVHDPEAIRELLKKAGFQIVSFCHKLLEDSEGQATTWYVIAKK